MRKLASGVLAAALLSGALLTGCSSDDPDPAPTSASSDATTDGPQSGGTLIWGSRSEPGNGGLDPFVAEVYRGTAIIALIYDTLVTKDDNGVIQPGIAASYTQVDGKTYQFTIREGVKFGDGSDLTVSDVIWSFEHHREAKGAGDAALAKLESITEVTPGVVEFKFSDDNPAFLNNISRATGDYFIVDQQWYEAASENDRQISVNGSGPFTLEAWEQGVELRLVKNSYYWDTERIHLDGITFKITGDDEGALLALVQQGAVDAAWFWGAEYAQQAEDSGWTRGNAAYTSARSLWIDPTFNNGALSDVRVRQAISLAIDREQVISLGTAGLGGITFVTPPAFTELAAPSATTPNYTRNVEQAKTLLAEAGVSDLEITLTYGTNTTDVSALEVIAQNLADAGITLKLNGVPYAEVQNVFTTGAPFMSELIYVVGTKAADPAAAYTSWLTDGGLVSHWQNNPDAEAAKALLAQINVETDPAVRIDLLNQLNAEVADKVLILTPYATPLAYHLWSSKVHGYQTDPQDGRVHLRDAWIEQ
ncbi:MAG: ABC transporter substrate-binding protein [Propionibacteriaceae bacterium]|nr:ABC transporter substrate-binding protein [Propionibacteriaceae bacterium]